MNFIAKEFFYFYICFRYLSFFQPLTILHQRTRVALLWNISMNRRWLIKYTHSLLTVFSLIISYIVIRHNSCRIKYRSKSNQSGGRKVYDIYNEQRPHTKNARKTPQKRKQIISVPDAFKGKYKLDTRVPISSFYFFICHFEHFRI